MAETREILMRTPGATPNEQALVPLAGVKDFYARDTDPGAVGMGSIWKDTSTGLFWERNAGDDGWDPRFSPVVVGAVDVGVDLQRLATASGTGTGTVGTIVDTVDGYCDAGTFARASGTGNASSEVVATAVSGSAVVSSVATTTTGAASGTWMAQQGAAKAGMKAEVVGDAAFIGFNGVTPSAIPELPATPTAQDIADVLVALGLVTQAA